MSNQFLPKEAIMEMIDKQNEKYKENLEEIEKIIKSLDPKTFIEHLKHSVYRNIKLAEILDTNYNNLTTSEKIALEAIDDLIFSNINAIKWIANAYNIDVNSDFGDTILKKEIYNVKFGIGKIAKQREEASIIDFNFGEKNE